MCNSHVTNHPDHIYGNSRVVTLAAIIFMCLYSRTVWAEGFNQISGLEPGTQLSSFTSLGERNARIAFHGGYLYLAPQNNGNASLWDISNPRQPRRIRDFGRRFGGAHTYGKVGNILIFTGSQALRATDPRNPTLFRFYGLYEDNSHFYPLRYTTSSGYGTPDATQQINNVVTGERLATINFASQTGIASGKALVMGNILLWVAFHSNAGIASYDVSDPRNPRLLDVISNVGGYEPTLYGHYVVTAHGSAANAAGVAPGVHVVDYSNPRDLRRVTHIPDNQVPGDHRYIQSQDEYIFVGAAKIDMRSFQVVQQLDNSNRHEFLLPLGNMLCMGDFSNQVKLVVHQREPDRRGPWVSYHLPQDGAVRQARSSRIGLHVPEHLETATIINGDTATVRPLGGQAIAGDWTHSSENILTFTPANNLAADTTYEVLLRAGGIEDVAGNAIDADIRFRFSTGDRIDGGPVDPAPNPTQSPFGNNGQRWPLAAGRRIPAEYFDNGGQGVAYHDTTPGNESGLNPRPGTDVDLATSEDSDNNDGGNGMYLGWLENGEWTEYSTQVTAGRYDILARVASASDAPGDLRLSLGGQVLGTFAVTNTGGWQNWRTLTMPNVSLTGGEQVLRLQAVQGGSFNVNWLAFRARQNAAPNNVTIVQVDRPGLINQNLRIRGHADDPDGDSLQYRFDFDDGNGFSQWSSTADVTHRFTRPGHHQIVMQVRDGHGGSATATRRITVLQSLPLPTAAQQSAPLCGDHTQSSVWTINPDNDSLTAINTDTNTKVWEVSVGAGPRSVACTNDNVLYVACRDADRIERRQGSNGELIQSIALPYGSAPVAILIDAQRDVCYVTLSGPGDIIRLSLADGSISGRLALGPMPQALALNPQGNRLLVTRFISNGENGTVWEINPADFTLRRTISIQHDPGPDGGSNGRGAPNYLHSLAFSPSGDEIRLASKKDNIRRGRSRDGNDLLHDQTTRCIVSAIVPGRNTDDLGRRVDLDNREQASAVLYAPWGDYVFAALQGNNEVVVIDAYNGDVVTRYETGRAPQGLYIDQNKKLYCKNFMDRSLDVYDLTPLLDDADPVQHRQATINCVSNESLSATILRGKKIFYNAADPRMSDESYISCAACHSDGAHDGRTWDFTDRGEGLRNTTDLRGRRGTGHGRVHWSANFDEIHDFEHDIRGPFGGTGLMSQADFTASATPLGPRKAGRSADLDALAAYVSSLATYDRSPHRRLDGSLTASARAGRNHFITLDCARCHGGDDYTDSASNVLHDIGTMTPSSGQRLGQRLTGIDTPTLRGIWQTAPYLHHGQASTLAAVFSPTNAPNGSPHAPVRNLSQQQQSELLDFLQQLDGTEPAVPPSTQTPPAAPRGLTATSLD